MEQEQIISTLDNVLILPGRAKGNTTRQINNAIDLLFQGKKIKIVDHWENGTHKHANLHQFNTLLDRISRDYYYILKVIEIDKVNLTIKFNIH